MDLEGEGAMKIDPQLDRPSGCSLTGPDNTVGAAKYLYFHGGRP